MSLEATLTCQTNTSSLSSASNRSTSVVASRSEQAGQLIRRAMNLFETDRRAAWHFLSMASTMLTDALDIIPSRCSVPASPSGLAHWQTKRVVDYIECNLESKIDVDKLAKLISVSKGHLSRGFKQRAGVPPMAFIAARRVERAKTMLISTREPIADIAAACGFGDQPHLTRWFRRVVGVTPGRYRRINTHLRCDVTLATNPNKIKPKNR